MPLTTVRKQAETAHVTERDRAAESKPRKRARHFLAQLSETSSRAEKTRTQLLEKLGEELLVHAKIEEEVFYPALRDEGKKQTNVIYHQCVEEHRAVEELVLPDLGCTSVTSDEFTGRAIVLKEMLEHHIQEEEEKSLRRWSSSSMSLPSRSLEKDCKS